MAPKRETYFAASANQQEKFAELKASNKTAQEGCVKTVRGKTKKQRGGQVRRALQVRLQFS
jgi:hypothetical protein